MIRINLLTEARRPAVRRARAGSSLSGEQLSQYLLVGGLLLCVLVCAVWWWMLRSALNEKNAEIRSAEREVQELAPIIKEVDDYKAKQTELEHKIAVISELKANQQGPVRVMDEISRSLPELLWLEKMEVKAGTVLLEGKAFNTNAIATFTENLDLVPEFQEPEFRRTQRLGEIYNFQLFLRYSLTPPPAATDAEGDPLDEIPAAEAAGG